MLEHGGRLRAAARHYGIPIADWLDLSTGINPLGWPVPPPPPQVWSRLPETDDGLEDAARGYYGCRDLLAVAGSQAAIQTLPLLRPRGEVAALSPSYAEHAHSWQRQGHRIIPVDAAQLRASGPPAEVLVLVNPNNPTGTRFCPSELLDWHARLARNGGWLIVDEAFVDATPGDSLAPYAPRPGLIVLRSLGKFFGLPGPRIGFVLAWSDLLNQLADRLGPWAVGGPARWVARQVLNDVDWQVATAHSLIAAGARLAALLTAHGLPPAGGTALFQWLPTAAVDTLHDRLARSGILVRRFADPPALRFGLPGSEAEWARLDAALGRLLGRSPG